MDKPWAIKYQGEKAKRGKEEEEKKTSPLAFICH
jgi:hypothetical protein